MGRFFIAIFILFFTLLTALSASDAEAISCKDARPATAPILLSAVASDKQVVLTWSEAADPLTHYLLAYGRSSIDMEYGNTNIGSKGTTSYTVTELTNGVKYYFKIRAENGCKPGKFSNKLSATSGQTVEKEAVRQYNLSIYKKQTQDVQGSSESAESVVPEKVIKAGNMIAGSQTTNCTSCSGFTLLVLEALLLISYLFLSGRYLFLKRIFIPLIPITLAIIFWQMGGSCSNQMFSCAYFYQLNIIVFMVIIILYKNRNNFKLNFISKLLKKGKK